jgi:hypothetical protein
MFHKKEVHDGQCHSTRGQGRSGSSYEFLPHWHTWSEVYGVSLGEFSFKNLDLLIKESAFNRTMHLIYEFI